MRVKSYNNVINLGAKYEKPVHIVQNERSDEGLYINSRKSEASGKTGRHIALTVTQLSAYAFFFGCLKVIGY
jgi:hypothetical protein